MVTEGENEPGDDSSPIAVPSFAPNWPNDDRIEGSWKSRYLDNDARSAIRWEAAYVWSCLLTGIAIIVALAILVGNEAVPPALSSMGAFAFAFLGGFFGGTLFTMKWLYHSVAKGLWNRDRRLWRMFTPFLSAGAALTIILLCSSGVLPFFGPDVVREPAGALGLSIVFGYFSDRAFSALENLASGLGMKKPKRAKSAKAREAENSAGE